MHFSSDCGDYNTSSEYTSNSDLAGKFAQSSELKVNCGEFAQEKPQLLNEDVLAYIELGTHWRLSSELTKNQHRCF